MDVNHCQAVSSGSAGLWCALKGLGVKPGDEVITSAFTFIATIEAILLAGAKPVCVDIDDTFGLDPIEVEKAITSKTKAIIAVHMLGNMCDIQKIKQIAKRHKLRLIEDACQAIGAHLNGRMAGTFGDAGVYSLDGGKTITCGEGGLVVTKKKIFHHYIRSYHDHGHSYNMPGKRAQELPNLIGFNFRMSELQAAYAIAQLAKLDDIIEKQHFNRENLKREYLLKERRRIIGTDDGSCCVIEIKKNQKIPYPTKNVPDALNWHFAGKWDHIFGRINGKWDKTKRMLETSAAIAVSAQ